MKLLKRIGIILMLLIIGIIAVECNKKTDLDTNDFNKAMENVFTGIWESNIDTEYIYYKFRNDSIEYQSSNERYMNSDTIKKIVPDSDNNLINIHYIPSGDGDTEELIAVIELNSNGTITLNENLQLKKIMT